MSAPYWYSVSSTLGPVDYGFTTGGDPNLYHKRVLGAGGFGTVHEVLFPKTKGF
jgi:hypothetical protein